MDKRIVEVEKKEPFVSKRRKKLEREKFNPGTNKVRRLEKEWAKLKLSRKSRFHEALRFVLADFLRQK